MDIFIEVMIGIVAVLHLCFLWLEMFAWTSRGKRVFKTFPPQFFEQSKTLAANQGLYNGFLATGLLWTLVIQDQEWKWNISVFFLICVAAAGIYGGLTASKKIFAIQALPALITLLLLLLTRPGF